MRKFVAPALIQLVFVAACGGGGGYGGGGNPPPPPPPPPPPMQVIATPGPPNVETLAVDAGPAANSVNTPFVSVKVCAPGSTTNCKTIDHIELDTGSSGLRILSSVLSAAPALTLPAEMGSSGNPLAECLQFADGSSWGPVVVADLVLPVSTEAAAGVNVQIIGDMTYPVPGDCPPPLENTVMNFGANGILGVGPFIQDCGSACVSAVVPGTYYSCPTPGSACGGTTASLAQQVDNPVSVFGTDSNGVIVELPAVGSTGSASTSGSLVFGIGTRTNNALGTATVLLADPTNSFITATYKGTVYTGGYLDSGSNANFFTDSSLATCTTSTGFYCPPSTMSETATLKGMNGVTLAANFSVSNAQTMFSANPSFTAFSTLGGPVLKPPAPPQPQPFDLGLAFFYGHNVFTAIENANASGSIGPYFAY